MKAVVITVDQWQEILAQIKKDHKPSVWLSREKMRKVLGFTAREHQEWLGYYDSASIEERKAGLHGYRTTVHIDFFTDYQRTMFLLKYGERIGNQIENG